MKYELFVPDRNKLARLYYGLATAFLLIRLKEHVLLSQLQAPVLTLVSTDITYMAGLFTGFSRFLTGNHFVGVMFDAGLIISAIVSFVYTRQKISSWVFTVLLGVYIVTGYTFLCFHKHNLVGIWFCSIIFLSVNETGFRLLFELIRYYCLFTYATSGFWKFYRGVWNVPRHFPVILKSDALQYLVEHPSTIFSGIISWLIIHPALLDNVMLVTSCIQLLFVVGFFTKRLDGFFFVFALTFHVLSFFLMRAYFLEFSVILITLLPLRLLYKPVTEPINS